MLQIPIRCTAKSLRTPNHNACMCFLNILFLICSPCPVIISTLLWRLSAKLWSVDVGICPFNHKSISEVWRWQPGAQLPFLFIPEFSGVGVRVLCRPLEFFHFNHGKPWMHLNTQMVKYLLPDFNSSTFYELQARRNNTIWMYSTAILPRFSQMRQTHVCCEKKMYIFLQWQERLKYYWYVCTTLQQPALLWTTAIFWFVHGGILL